MSDDYGSAIKTGDLAGDSAEMIVVPDNSTFSKHEKTQYHWGDTWAVIIGPW